MNEKFQELRNKITLNPIMAFLIITVVVIIISGILSLIGVDSTYNVLNEKTGEYKSVFINVKSLFNLSGIKYIFSNTVSNFVSFTPLSSLIIILIGIGIMEKSGFLRTAFTLLTKICKKNVLTFIVAFLGVVASICGEISYVVLIPLAALLYKYGKRNPLIGVITAFAGLTCGSGLSILLTSVDTTMLADTTKVAQVLDPSFLAKNQPFIVIMIIASILIALAITFITERRTALKLDKYVLPKEEQEFEITRKDLKGLVIALLGGLLFIFIFVYNIIPGLPLSGALLDNTQIHYIDKLFSYSSFFSQGFVFIITFLFIIFGLLYGLGAKTIKSNNDFCRCLSHSLDGSGKAIVLILVASIFISVFKKTEIGTVITGGFANIISSTGFTGIPLIILLFLIGIVTAFVLPSALSRWNILSGVTVPIAMNAGLSPEFSQIIIRFGESVSLGLSPVMAYFVIYLAFLEMYSPEKKPVNLTKSLKYLLPYSLLTCLILIVLLISWYLIGLPIGFGTSVVL